ncbi:WXG100 family type VII secretion target [Litorihabitans aurantiacus]|uniref:WXG100 family type VII secretion target n=1 Tax=Litorihabitans aurantiacus TaxID=1930061 RepID=A0AA37UML4_9MICO|nr:WXG100 family type VII secretion target [Litorihabitans aurantiacus]GMA30754.1 hypothetical protein GCM10025875_07460 [Litorihabitans aurantiacus]
MYDRNTFYGIDPEYSRNASRGMEQGAGDLGSLVGSISAMLDSITWEGAGAKRFLGDWNGALRPELQAVTQSLTESAHELRRRAEMQEQASS